MLPNYLLDDFVPSPDAQAASDPGSQASASHHLPAGPSTQQLFDGGHGSATNRLSGDASDASIGPPGLLPRRKKKLKQACVYCRRSHLVCEEKRPCHRCVKRGIADRCVDPPQEGQLPQDNAWAGATETGSAASTSQKDVYISPPPPRGSGDRTASSSSTPGELAEAERGQKRKRKTKSQAGRDSADQCRGIDEGEPQPDYKPSQGALEFAEASYTSAPGHGPSNEMDLVPAQSAAPYTSIASSLPPTAEPTVARSAPSQLLQVQPIFQPPSSAELDSLFSTYFFDVADAFNTRSNGVYPPGLPPPHQAQSSHLYPHQQHPAANTTSHPANIAPMPHQHSMSDPLSAGTIAHNHVQTHQRPAPDGHHPRSEAFAPAPSTATNGANPPRVDAGPTHNATMAVDRETHRVIDARRMSSGQDPTGRQKPGDVYAPYPYRKGYASLMRYMTEQNWSEQSIRSVEAALSKIRRLWFSLEDNIQPSSMIQLQAEWAGNVRYFSESVIPFTPVPMVVCRKAGEVYASNTLAQDLCGRSREQMTGGRISVYELMTEASASKFFRLYELAVSGTQAEDGSYVPSVGKTEPLYWNAEIVKPSVQGAHTVVPTRGIFEMKIAPCGLPSLLVCCFVPLS